MYQRRMAPMLKSVTAFTIAITTPSTRTRRISESRALAPDINATALKMSWYSEPEPYDRNSHMSARRLRSGIEDRLREARRGIGGDVLLEHAGPGDELLNGRDAVFDKLLALVESA